MTVTPKSRLSKNFSSFELGVNASKPHNHGSHGFELASLRSRPHAPASAAKLDAARHIKSFNSINDPSNVFMDGAMVGRDPDPNVRLRLLLQSQDPF